MRRDSRCADDDMSGALAFVEFWRMCFVTGAPVIVISIRECGETLVEINEDQLSNEGSV